MLTAFALMLCWGYDVPGGDGNYFISGLAPAIALGFAAAWRRVGAHSALRKPFLIVVFAFCFFQAGYAFLTACWSPGTRAWDFDFGRSFRALGQDSDHVFRENGMTKIAAYLGALHTTPRVVGCSAKEDTVALRLPASFENISQISYARPEFTDTLSHFRAFLESDHIHYLLLPHRENSDVKCKAEQVMAEALDYYGSRPETVAVDDAGYVLFDLTAKTLR
jgi:hypothetical protein